MTSLSIDWAVPVPEWERVPVFWNLFCLFNCSSLIFPLPFGLVGGVYHFKGRRRSGVAMVKL
jgi:hypothetical protein